MKNKQVFTVTILIITILIAGCRRRSSEEYVSGKVVKALDGDTYDLLLNDGTTVRIRMEGIDAPEKGMPFSHVSKEYLGKLCQGQTVEAWIRGEDRHGRKLAFTYLEDGREVSREMLKAGLAWHYKEYNSDEELSDLETEARQAKRGLWKDANPMAPWDNRRLHRQGVSTKDMYETTENTDTQSNEDTGKYVENSLSTGSTPYLAVYGGNPSCKNYGCSEIKVITPSNSDVIVTIKRNGKVVRHAYIRANSSFSFQMVNGTYQPFFYYGKGWNPDKIMKETEKGVVKGGFVTNEVFGKDDPQTLKNQQLTYELILQSNGNFSTKPSNAEEAL
jgi:endonuclease YncB( thermonuclease family)